MEEEQTRKVTLVLPFTLFKALVDSATNDLRIPKGQVLLRFKGGI